MKRNGHLLLHMLIVWASGTPVTKVHAQIADAGPHAAARAALVECAALAGSAEDAASRDRARSAYETARRAFRDLIAARPDDADAHAGLGETISRCGIPLAGMAAIMGVVEESNAVLETALRHDPAHWQARFILAMNYFHMPVFLNRTGEAIRHLELLRQQQDERADPLVFAQTYIFLGDAYARTNRAADARAVWLEGVRLFPDNAQLRQRMEESGGMPRAEDAGTESPARAARPAALPDVHALTPLRVDAAQQQLDEARSGTSLRRIDVMTMPGGTGEMLQTLQALPGTTRAGDGADLYVRGGDPAETPVFVNGGRIAYPGRWETLSGATMGVLDASVLSRAYFSAGGFSAKYGDALSGVVDIETLGRPAAPLARIGINMVSLAGTAFRPLGGGAGAWGTMLLTDVRVVARMNGDLDTYPDVPQSYQFATGGAVDVSPGTELRVVGLASGDRASRTVEVGGYEGAFASTGSTQHVALGIRRLSGDGRAGVQAALTGSRRGGGYDYGVLTRDRTDIVFGGRLDADVVGAGVRVRGGLEAARYDARIRGTVPLTGRLAPGSPVRVLDDERDDASHIGGYIETETVVGGITAAAGARADRLPGSDRATLDPRAALAYTAGDWTVRGGAGVFHQGSRRRTYRLPDSGAPAGVPTRARHAVIGAERTGEPAVRIEAYVKRYDDYVAEGEAPVQGIEAGRARGIDAMIRWQRRERLNGWITWGLLDSRIELADGTGAPARFDITHTITAVARFALARDWELGSTVRYATGRPHTPVIGALPPPRDGWPPAPLFGPPHSERLPEYFRVDGRITRYARFDGGAAVIYLEMLDLNGRRNVMDYQYDANWTERKPVESFFSRRTFVLGVELSFQ